MLTRQPIQYLAICNTATETLALACPEALATGITILLCMPFFLLAAAWIRIKRLVKKGDLEYIKNPRPSFKEARETISKTKGCCGKLVMLKILWNKSHERGDWEDNEKSVMWAWIASSFVGGFWIFAVWTMTKKLILSAILNLTDGNLNSLLALIVQFSDSALTLITRPHIDRKTDFNECFGAITNLMTYCVVTIPDLTGLQMPPEFGDMFQANEHTDKHTLTFAFQPVILRRPFLPLIRSLVIIIACKLPCSAAPYHSLLLLLHVWCLKNPTCLR